MNYFSEETHRGGISLSLWRGLVHFALAYRWHVIALVVVMAMVGIVDAAFPALTQVAIDRFVVPGQTGGLERFILGYLGIVVLQSVNVFLLIALAGSIEMGLVHDIRRDAFDHLQKLGFAWFDRTPVGWIMARLTSDAQRLGEVVAWGIVDIVWGAVTMVAVVAFMLVMDWRLALITLSVVPPLALASRWFQRRILRTQRLVRRTNSRISGAYNEGITGARASKTLVREDANLAEFQVLTRRMERSSVRAATYSAIYLPVVLSIASIGTALALGRGGAGVIAGTVTVGTLAAFLTWTVQFFEPVQELARVLAEFQSAQASAERIVSLLGTAVEIRDDPDRVLPGVVPVRGDLEFQNVSFAYREGQPVLSNFSLHVPAGQTIALVGETGSGKSTIVNLTCRFYEPTEGSILVDGLDYRSYRLEDWQGRLGYVLQAPHLFSGSIRENIRYGRLDATDAEVEEAARLVRADSFIQTLPDGYDTSVGEGGSLLSTGQKQLVSFARAVLADPMVFVLDEATSSIDTETELLIQAALDRLLSGRTSIVVAHRLSTICRADRILVISQGQILEDGTHRELLTAGGQYAELYRNQFSEEVMEMAD